MADVFIEVEEAMKQERLERLWKKYGNTLVSLVLAIVLGTAGWAGYKAWEENIGRKQTAQFIEAQKQDDPATVLAGLAPSFRPGLAAVAQLQAAGDMLEAGLNDKAADIYNNVANDEKAPVEFRELARFTLARLESEKNPEGALDLLASLTDGTGAWRHHARLEAAVILAHTKQDYARARDQLAALLTERAVPQSLSRKAKALDILYALKQQEMAAPEKAAIQPAAAAE